MELSPEQKQLLVAAAQCQGRITPEELAKKAGCHPSFVYQNFQDPMFRECMTEVLRGDALAAAPEILTKFSELGKKGEFKHGKLVLQIAGLYKDEKTIKGDIGVRTDSPFKDEEERVRWAKATLTKLVEEKESENE